MAKVGINKAKTVFYRFCTSPQNYAMSKASKTKSAAAKSPATKSSMKQKALDYHRLPKPGKLSVESMKPCATQQELSLAYSPGVAEPVREIAKNPKKAYDYTNKGNLVAVVSNGTAILGLGNLGPLASKPVMEGKGVLFKRFAGIDVYDIEINAKTVKEVVSVVEAIAPTFGGINLEDIAAPECFEIEAQLKKKLDIPVFHDDQHGTAVIICAGLINALHIQGKSLDSVKIVCLGAGAAGLSSMNLLVAMGAKKSNITLVDSRGVVSKSRTDLNKYKKPWARATQATTLAEVMAGADVFIGVSGANLVSPAMVKSMADKPVVFALANPDPEITPDKAHKVRKDLIMATGRSDYPNQVNNVLGFPFIFRGTLDARAKTITQEMLIAASRALAELAREKVPHSVLKAYGLKSLKFGPEYILPKPFDPRLIDRIPAAIIRAVKHGK
jgi:malate dehydrogenase (oxaloacetate-decarboxylating)(NADP+)